MSQPAVAPSDGSEASPPPARPGPIAFQGNLADESTGIYLIGADGSDVTRVVDQAGIHELDPVWSPDGRWIAYHALVPDGSQRGGVFIVDPGAPEAEPRQITGDMAYGAPT